MHLVLSKLCSSTFVWKNYIQWRNYFIIIIFVTNKIFIIFFTGRNRVRYYFSLSTVLPWNSHLTSIHASAILQGKLHYLHCFFCFFFRFFSEDWYTVLFFTESISLEIESVSFYLCNFIFNICYFIFKYLSSAKIAFRLVNFLDTNLRR